MMTSSGPALSMRRNVSPNAGEPTMPLHERDNVRQQPDDCVFVGRDLTAPVRSTVSPRMRRREAGVRGGVGRADARRQLPPEPGHVLSDMVEPDIFSLMALSIDKNMITRTSIPSCRERAAVRAHAGRTVACDRGCQYCRRVGHRLLGNLHAGGDGRQTAVAGEAAGRRRAGDKPNMVVGRYRWTGTSSRATGTSKCARSRCPMAIT